MKRKLCVVCMLIFMALLANGLADVDRPNNSDEPAIWIFYEPEPWDLTYEEALAILRSQEGAVTCAGEYYYDVRYTEDGLFRQMIHSESGEMERGWHIVYHLDGSPYTFDRWFVSSPDGQIEASGWPHLYCSERKEYRISDTEAAEIAFRWLVKNGVVDLRNEDAQLVSVHVDREKEPKDYTYEWFFRQTCTMPLDAVFQMPDGGMQNKRCYLQVSLNDTHGHYSILFFEDTDIRFWYLDTPVLSRDPLIFVHVDVMTGEIVE